MPILRRNRTRSRYELTRNYVNLDTRLNWMEKHIYGEALGEDFRTLPPPPRKTISDRLELLEAKMDLIIDHLGLEVKKQPQSIRLEKREDKSN